MTTESIDKLFLELSQFTQAKTKNELSLEAKLKIARDSLKSLSEMKGRDGYDSQSLRDFRALAKEAVIRTRLN